MADGIYDYNSTEGIIVPDTSEIKAGVEDEFREALGSDLSLESSTPQGRLIAAETRARTAVMHNNAAMANLINPAEAYGVYLDALCALTGISRRTAQPTTVTGVRLYGTNGTVVPAGSPDSPSAKTEDGDYFYLASDVVINVSDGEGHYYGTGTFISCETGPVPCGAGKLNEIAEGHSGWDSVINDEENGAATAEGTDTETDASLKARRASSLQQGSATLQSIITAVRKTGGVLFANGYENYTGSPLTKTSADSAHSITLPAHSILLYVQGGAEADIARAIFKHKTIGCAMTDVSGGTAAGTKAYYDVRDDVSGETYRMTFARPLRLEIYAKITVSLPSIVTTAGMEDSIKKAAQDYINGEIPGVDKVELGGSVNAFEMASAITQAIPELFIADIRLAKSSADLASDPQTNIGLAFCQYPHFSSSNITVVFG